MEFKIKCDDESFNNLITECIDIRRKISDSISKISEIILRETLCEDSLGEDLEKITDNDNG
mgnify:CR=1 FL=1|tara:strand:+ start:151 stop:333 length:183 start_codon:yes stop_codon:yes gene_type:complete